MAFLVLLLRDVMSRCHVPVHRVGGVRGLLKLYSRVSMDSLTVDPRVLDASKTRFNPSGVFLFIDMMYLHFLLLIHDLGGGFKHFLFSPLPGQMIQFD